MLYDYRVSRSNMELLNDVKSRNSTRYPKRTEFGTWCIELR